MPSISFRSIFKTLAVLATIGFGVWVLWPTAEEVSTPAEATGPAQPAQTKRKRADVRYRIQISPAAFYQPGIIPEGIGNPLKGLSQVVAEFEALHPDTEVDIVNVPATVREFLVTQLSSGKAPDIINVDVKEVWPDTQKGWYIALDPYLDRPNPFVPAGAPGSREWWEIFKYQNITRSQAGPDGNTYCIPYDLVETGVYYNKDIFKKVGVEPPQTWDELLEMMGKLKQSGYIPMVMSMDTFEDWCLDLFFDQLYYGLMPGIDLLHYPKREAYQQGYLDWDEICYLYKKGFFTPRDPRYREIWRLMRQFRGYCNQNLTTMDHLRAFVSQSAAMFWRPSTLTHRLAADKKLGFEWGVFYLPPFTKKTTPYASETPMCVIGGAGTQFEVTNSAISDTGDARTSVRLQRVIALLQFLTVPKNYVRIVNEYACYLPNVAGVDALPPLKPFEDILKRRYTTTKWYYAFGIKFAEIQHRMLELYLNDGIMLDEFVDWMDKDLEGACAHAVTRTPPDWNKLDRAWEKGAPARATMKDLPHE